MVRQFGNSIALITLLDLVRVRVLTYDKWKSSLEGSLRHAAIDMRRINSLKKSSRLSLLGLIHHFPIVFEFSL